MKVNLTNYPRWWGPFQIAELLEHVGVSNEKCRTIGHYFRHTKVNDICEAVQAWRVKWFYKQKVVIEPWDTWSLDSTLAKIALPMLKQLAKDKCGAPSDMLEFCQVSNNSTQETFGFYAEGDDAAWEAGHKRWTDILDKMIWSFEQILDEQWEEQFFKQGFDRKGYMEYHQRIQEGLELFGKHYRSLWD